jgi:hypothetical protein
MLHFTVVAVWPIAANPSFSVCAIGGITTGLTGRTLSRSSIAS